MGKILKTTWNEFVYGGYLVFGVGAGIIWSVIILLELPFSWQVLLIACLIAQIIYIFNHFKEIKEDLETNPERVKQLQKTIKHFPFLFSFYVLALLTIIILFFNPKVFLFVLVLTIGGLLYTIYFKNLTTKVVCFKNIYISLFWSLGIFIVPFYYSISLNYFFVLFFCFVFFRVLTNTIFFDIKDINSDRKERLKTLPVLIGQEKTLKFLSLMNFISFFPLLLGVFFGIIPFFGIVMLLFYFYSWYYIKKSEKSSFQDIRKISYLMVDGEYLLWPILLIIGKSII